MVFYLNRKFNLSLCHTCLLYTSPLAAQYSTPETKGKNVGIILSGLLTGILASRVVSGIVGEYMGWRFIYFIAAGLMVVCLLIIIRILPDLPSNYQGSYAGLMKSLFSIVKKYPQLRIACLLYTSVITCYYRLHIRLRYFG